MTTHLKRDYTLLNKYRGSLGRVQGAERKPCSLGTEGMVGFEVMEDIFVRVAAAWVCPGETLCTGVFSSTLLLLQAVLAAAPVLVPEEHSHGVCSLPVWYRHLPCAGGGIVPALSAVCQWTPRVLDDVF